MAHLLSCEKLVLEYPTKLILDKVSFGLHTCDYIGLLGPNGEGKSSLLKLLARTISPNSGRVLYNGSLRIAYLAQRDSFDDAATIRDVVLQDIPEFDIVSKAHYREILDALLQDLSWVRTIGTLSGGQRRRVDLARVLIQESDILLLDEPTNHLDMQSIAWLAKHLQERKSKKQDACVLVTHDRWFLDEVAHKIFEIHDGKLDTYEGGFSAYVFARVERDRLVWQAEQKRKNLMRKELAWLSRGARARTSKPKFHLEAARALIAEEPPVRNSIELKRMACARLGKRVIECEGLGITKGGTCLLRDCNWIIGPGDRIGIVGDNGAGKTSLLKVLLGEEMPSAGRIVHGVTVRSAFLSQQLSELNAHADERVFEVLGRYKTRYVIDGQELSPAQMIERLGFKRDHLQSRIKDLSGGQARRLQFMLILLQEPNVLVLDEPGNDLDTDMMAALEDVLDSYPGTLIVVSHDRYLMERITDDQYELSGASLQHLPRGIDEYLEHCKVRTGEFRAVKQGQDKPASTKVQASKGRAAASHSGAELYKMKKAMESCMRKIETLDAKIARSKNLFLEVDPSNYVALQEVQREIDALKEQKQALEEEWYEYALVLEDA